MPQQHVRIRGYRRGPARVETGSGRGGARNRVSSWPPVAYGQMMKLQPPGSLRQGRCLALMRPMLSGNSDEDGGPWDG